MNKLKQILLLPAMLCMSYGSHVSCGHYHAFAEIVSEEDTDISKFIKKG